MRGATLIVRGTQILIVCLLVAMATLIGGCRHGWLPPGDNRPSDEPLYLAKLQYTNGNYGLAEKYFRQAVESNGNSVDAWLGLAASYDRLKRFDLADRAYDNVVRLVGYTPTVLNNLGYSNLLRGDLVQARKYLREAAAKDPNNPHIQYNIHLMRTWAQSHGGAVQ